MNLNEFQHRNKFYRACLLAGIACSFLATHRARADEVPTTARDVSLEEVVVTAQRREERARDVPISISVLSPEALEIANVVTIRDLREVTPGLLIDRNGVSLQPAIRGITAVDGNPGNDANVAIYLDGVYQPSPAANNFDLPDVEQIEVLNGPQGTLFGRNATGGAILISTKKPSFDPHGMLTVGYGNLNDRIFKGFVTGPIIPDRLAGSLAGYWEENDGYLHDLVTGKMTGRLKSRGLRGKLLWDPSDNVSILAEGHWSKRYDGSILGQPQYGNTAARFIPGTTTPRPGVIIPIGPWNIASDVRPRVDTEDKGGSLRAEIDLRFAKLTSISAYDESNTDLLTEDDYTTAFLAYYQSMQTQKTFSQELTLATTNSGPLNWTTGAFYYNDNAAFDPLLVAYPGFNFNIYGRQRTRAWAIFGEVHYDITDRLNLILGARYSHERRILSGAFVVDAFPGLAAANFNSVTPRVALRYSLTKDTNLYATFSEGFKSGGYDASSLGTTAFLPESLHAYEVGVKSAPSQYLDFNAAAFYYDYTNQQVQTTVIKNGAPLGLTTNAASSHIYGGELSATVRPTSEFSVTTGLALLHARYFKYPNALVDEPVQLAGAPVPCLCGNVATTINATGNALPRSPDLTFSATANYRKAVSVGTFDVSGSLFYSDKFYFTGAETVSQPAYTTVSARASFQPAGTGFKISLWGKNLANRVIYQGASVLPDASGVLFAPPRTYGVELQYRF